MNYLSCMLRLIVCLCLGFASFSAWANEQDITDKANETLINKVFDCDPVFLKQVQSWRRIGDDSFADTLNRSIPEFFRFNACAPQDVSMEMLKAFFNKYVNFQMKGVDAETGRERHKNGLTLDEAKQKFEEGGWAPEVISVRASFEADKREKIEREAKQEEEQKRVAEKAEKEAQSRMRQSKLKSGAIPVASFDDAFLLHEPKHLWGVMESPLLMPDKLVYGGDVDLDRQENENTLLAKSGDSYATLKLTKKTVNYSQKRLRIGGGMSVIGRYVKNQKYTTGLGGVKIVPVLEVMYIGDTGSIRVWEYKE